MTLTNSKYLLLVVAVILSGCDKCSSPDPSATTAVVPTETPAPTENSVAELQISDIKPGTGDEATDGKKVTMHYTATLADGTKFDSSLDRDTPFSFTLGSGLVIAGWDIGVKGMKVGGVRKLVIPPHLAYGSRSVASVIPPNATLIFEIELLKVEDPSQ
jgi:FKBP-type peptidyl-prolyl cis-trans isomerase